MSMGLILQLSRSDEQHLIIPSFYLINKAVMQATNIARPVISEPPPQSQSFTLLLLLLLPLLPLLLLISSHLIKGINKSHLSPMAFSKPPPAPLPPHTLKFTQSASPQTLLKILSSFSVKLDTKSFSSPSSRTELEHRIKLLLSDSQRLSTVLPLTKTTYSNLPSWKSTKPPSRNFEPGKGPMGRKFSECASVGQTLSAKASSSGGGRETGEDVYTDACQTLMSIGHGFDIGHPTFTLQDTRRTSAISLRIVNAKSTLLDKTLPLVFVLFYHETRDHISPSSPALKWMQAMISSGPINSVTSPLQEQHLILRQLIYNSRRLPPGCESMFAAARNSHEKDFIPSFLLPLDTLSQDALTNLNCTSTCAACPLPASSLCEACCIVQYCSTTCQRTHRAIHKSFCTRISESARSVIVNATLKTGLLRALAPKAVTNLSRHMSQRDMTRMKADVKGSLLSDEGLQLSRKRRGTKERFVVKMQVPLMPGGDLMMYDAERTFQVFVGSRGSEAYRELWELANGCVRWKGLKVFVYARHVEGERNKEKLEVLTEVLPDQEQFW